MWLGLNDTHACDEDCGLKDQDQDQDQAVGGAGVQTCGG